MTDSLPRISLVIPTRERAETLRHTLRTCTSQDYENLEIIVSDNCSADDTRDVVTSCGDSRVRYVNPGRRLSMSDNFEFAFQAVTGEFVLYIGDDDAVLPGALSAAASLLRDSGSPAIGWTKLEYLWPTELTDGTLQVPLDAALYRYDAAKAVRQALWLVRGKLWFPWTRLPVIMTSFVSTDALRRLRAGSGRLFWSSQPDVYSGFAIASVVSSYLFSLRPFTVNGGSRYSNGRASSAQGEQGVVAEQFARENEASESLPDGKLHVRGAVVSCVLEAAHYANRYAYEGRLKIDYRALLVAAAAELGSAPPAIYRAGLEELAAIARRTGVRGISASALRKRYPNRPVERDRFEYGLTARGCVSINPAAAGLHDVSAAADFAAKILPPYPVPVRVRQYSSLGRIFGQAYRIISARVADKTL